MRVSPGSVDVMHEMLELMTGAARREEVPPVANVVARLRTTHHLLARALAEGRSREAAGRLAGYSPTTVATLEADPGFRELVSYYEAQVEDIFESVQDRLAALGLAALDELQQRLEEDPGQFTAGALLKISEAMLDRSVAPTKGGPMRGAVSGPTAIQVNVQFTRPEGPTLELKAEQ